MSKMTIFCLLLAFIWGQPLLAACLWVVWELSFYQFRREHAFRMR